MGLAWILLSSRAGHSLLLPRRSLLWIQDAPSSIRLPSKPDRSTSLPLADTPASCCSAGEGRRVTTFAWANKKYQLLLCVDSGLCYSTWHLKPISACHRSITQWMDYASAAQRGHPRPLCYLSDTFCAFALYWVPRRKRATSIVPRRLTDLRFQLGWQQTWKAEGGELEQPSCLTSNPKVSLEFSVRASFFQRQPTLLNHSSHSREATSSRRVGAGRDCVTLCWQREEEVERKKERGFGSTKPE